MSIETQVLQLDDYEDLLAGIKHRYLESGMKFGWKSNKDKSYDHGHWTHNIFYPNPFHPIDVYNSPYIVHHPEIASVWELVRTKFDGPRALGTVYLNGYTYGTDAYIHIDNTGYLNREGAEINCETAVLYTNDSWTADWAGETVILDEHNEIEASVLPKPGRILIFDGLKPHGARPVSRACPELRQTLAFKAINPQVESPAANFLIKEMRDVVVNRKAYFELLYDGSKHAAALTEDKDISTATLFRGVYGLEELPLDKGFTREQIKELIGERAEYLVHEFSKMKERKKALHLNENFYDQKTLEDLLIMQYCDIRESYTGYNYAEHTYILELRQKVNEIIKRRYKK